MPCKDCCTIYHRWIGQAREWSLTHGQDFWNLLLVRDRVYLHEIGGQRWIRGEWNGRALTMECAPSLRRIVRQALMETGNEAI